MASVRIPIFLLLSWLLAFPVWAASLPIQDLAVFVDIDGTETIDSVSRPDRAHSFVPAPHGFSAGYTRKVHWLRFRLAAPEEKRLLLEIQPPYLDDLRLYQPDTKEPNGFRMAQTGDRMPFSARDVPSRGFVFRLLFPNDQAQTVYLRLETTSTSLLALRAWVPADYVNAQGTEYLLLGLYYGLLFALLLFNLWHGHWRSDSTHRAFLAYLIGVIVFMVGFNGFVAQYLAPNAPIIGHYWVSLMVPVTTALGAHFHRHVLEIDGRTPWLNGYFLALIVASAMTVLALIAGYFREAVAVLMLFALVLPVVSMVRTRQLQRQGRAGSNLLALAYTISLLAYFVNLSSLQGWLPGSFFKLYSFQFGALLALLAFNSTLFVRIRDLERRHVIALNDARHAQYQRDVEKLSRERQGALLSMLTHELKTPLSVIRLNAESLDQEAAPRQRVDRAISEMDAIINRCVFVDGVDQGHLAENPQYCDVSAILAQCVADQTESHRIRIESAPLQSGYFDTGLLQILLSNLLENALKYSPPGSEVTVLANTQQQGIGFTVFNPIGPAGRPDPARVFERYYRAPAAQRHRGSGLGLFLVRAIAEHLGGRVDYCADDHEQIRFSLWLPILSDVQSCSEEKFAR